MWTLTQTRHRKVGMGKGRGARLESPSRFTQWVSSFFGEGDAQDRPGRQAGPWPAPADVSSLAPSELPADPSAPAPSQPAMCAQALSRLVLDDVPSHLSLRLLRTHYPEILQQIAARMGQPHRLQALFDDLLLAQDGGHPRLPFAVTNEISNLRYHLQHARGDADRRDWNRTFANF